MLVCIGIPSGGSIKARTITSLMNLIYSLRHIGLKIVIPTGNVLINNQQIVEEALKAKADYLLFIDADMVFPPDALTKLLAHDKDIIGVHYNNREMPLVSTIRMLREDGNFYQVDTKLMPRRLFECGSVGKGLVLIKMRVFEKIKKPWYEFQYKDGELMTEDINFCLKAHKAGFRVWCDPTIKVKHIGDYLY
jgi:GT2 family glycosyltransferase